MNREELRDHLLAPVLQWTQLGRQTSVLMTASGAVINARGRHLLRAGVFGHPADADEIARMAREKIDVPLESATAMAAAMVPAVSQFWTHAGVSMLAWVTDSVSLATSRTPEEFCERQEALRQTMINAGVGWFRVLGTAAEVVGQGVAPVLRQVQDNAARLDKR